MQANFVMATRRGLFSALAEGPERGPVVLCLHGFPDSPLTFRALSGALADAGYRVIAPWLRGYSPSPLEGPYGPRALGEDLLAMADLVRCERVIGHDWGAIALYAALDEAPDRFRAAVTVAVPHIAAFARNTLRQPMQLWRSRYIGLFQVPRSEQLVARDDFAYVDQLWRRWSPGWSAPVEHLAHVKRTLARSGGAPLEHYRALPRELGHAMRRRARISTPVLFLAGAEDGCIAPSIADGQARRFGGRYEARIVEGAGHFVHAERPVEVNAAILDWLRAAQ